MSHLSVSDDESSFERIDSSGASSPLNSSMELIDLENKEVQAQLPTEAVAPALQAPQPHSVLLALTGTWYNTANHSYDDHESFTLGLGRFLKIELHSNPNLFKIREFNSQGYEVSDGSTRKIKNKGGRRDITGRLDYIEDNKLVTEHRGVKKTWIEDGQLLRSEEYGPIKYLGYFKKVDDAVLEKVQEDNVLITRVQAEKEMKELKDNLDFSRKAEKDQLEELNVWKEENLKLKKRNQVLEREISELKLKAALPVDEENKQLKCELDFSRKVQKGQLEELQCLENIIVKLKKVMADERKEHWKDQKDQKELQEQRKILEEENQKLKKELDSRDQKDQKDQLELEKLQVALDFKKQQHQKALLDKENLELKLKIENLQVALKTMDQKDQNTLLEQENLTLKKTVEELEMKVNKDLHEIPEKPVVLEDQQNQQNLNVSKPPATYIDPLQEFNGVWKLVHEEEPIVLGPDYEKRETGEFLKVETIPFIAKMTSYSSTGRVLKENIGYLSFKDEHVLQEFFKMTYSSRKYYNEDDKWRIEWSNPVLVSIESGQLWVQYSSNDGRSLKIYERAESIPTDPLLKEMNGNWKAVSVDGNFIISFFCKLGVFRKIEVLSNNKYASTMYIFPGIKLSSRINSIVSPQTDFDKDGDKLFFENNTLVSLWKRVPKSKLVTTIEDGKLVRRMKFDNKENSTVVYERTHDFTVDFQRNVLIIKVLGIGAVLYLLITFFLF